MRKTETAFYFALPRLFARGRGMNDSRTEMNWLEANVVGGAVHGIGYLFAAQFFLRGLASWAQALLLLPLAAGVWLAWLVILHINSLLIRLLRAGGLLRGLPDDRAQSVLIGAMITGLAIALWRADSWCSFAGGIWIAALVINLAAALALVLLSRNGTAAA